MQLEIDENKTMLEMKQHQIKSKSEEKGFYETKKQLEEEITQALKTGDMATLEQKVEEFKSHVGDDSIEANKVYSKELEERLNGIKEAISSCDRELQSITMQEQQKIEEVSNSRNKQLIAQPKQNIFAKALGNIFNKINGTKKFTRGVVEPLKEQIEQIREEEIPKLKVEIDSKRKTFIDNVEQKKAEIEKNVAEKVEMYTEKISNTKEATVQKVSLFKKAVLDRINMGKEKANETKENIVLTAKDKIEDAQIFSLMAEDFVKDKVKDAQIMGLCAQDFIKDKIVDTKEMAVEAQKYINNKVQNAKDSITKRKEAIVADVYEKKNQAIQFARKTKDNVIQFGKDTKENAINKVHNTKDSVTTYAQHTVETGKRTYKEIINKKYEIQNKMITSAQRKLVDQQLEIAQKRELLNKNVKENDGYEIGD